MYTYMEYECENPECKQIFIKINKQIFCTLKCAHRHNYLKNKNKYLAKARKWATKNPEKSKVCLKKSLKKFIKNKPERFNELARECYRRNKDEPHSRGNTRRILNSAKYKSPLLKKCACGSTKNLTLKFNIYPKSTEKIKEALESGKIYYNCKECRYKNHGKKS